MIRKLIYKLSALLVLSLASGAALAHPGHEHLSGFAAGFAHPFLGLDHLLAMIALGIWAAQSQGRSMFVAPAIFVASMLLGALFALKGGNLPYAEHGIALSVLVIGLLVALVPAQGPVAKLALPVIAVGAALHGYAHGAELPAEAGAAAYIAGFSMATALLHAVGILIGLQLQSRIVLRRGAGILVAIAGSALVWSA